MKDSPIILLDEALSSLDAENAVAIQKGIEEMIKGKTVFLVSHTLSYIQNADQILVLSDGFLQGCENMMNYYNQCLFIKLCGKKKIH